MVTFTVHTDTVVYIIGQKPECLAINSPRKKRKQTQKNE